MAKTPRTEKKEQPKQPPKVRRIHLKLPKNKTVEADGTIVTRG